ncbi:hypothetical protein [Paraburkholderia sediminicola]|uniref:hypothetical protein n=1 Tax=Paraburkholderia sediminicola TaxID=458836 RepID=UPI0038BE1E26
MNDLTELDLAMGRRALETATAPVFSLGSAIQAARQRHLRGEIGPTQLMDESTRPRDRDGAALWDRMQSAKSRVIAYDAQPKTPATPSESSLEHLTEAELRERIEALRKSQQ